MAASRAGRVDSEAHKTTPNECPHCAALVLKNEGLRAHIRALEAQLGLEPQIVELLGAALGLPPSQARILLRLYRAAPRFLATELLLSELATPTEGNLKVTVHKLKKAMGEKMGQRILGAAPGAGYRVTPVGKAKLDELLGQEDAAEAG